jgi:hypothetical protein
VYETTHALQCILMTSKTASIPQQAVSRLSTFVLRCFDCYASFTPQRMNTDTRMHITLVSWSRCSNHLCVGSLTTTRATTTKTYMVAVAVRCTPSLLDKSATSYICSLHMTATPLHNRYYQSPLLLILLQLLQMYEHGPKHQ